MIVNHLFQHRVKKLQGLASDSVEMVKRPAEIVHKSPHGLNGIVTVK
jgi:hypothetical protein